MKPLITITDNELLIDTDQYKLALIFKQQPVTSNQQPAISNMLPEDITVFRSLAKEQPASLITPKQKQLKPSVAAQPMHCLFCNKEFEPKRKDSKTCSATCSKSYHSRKRRETFKALKPSKPIKTASNPKAAAYDKKQLAADKKEREMIKSSPDTSKQIPVRIDEKTMIYIKPGQDPEQAKKRFLKKLEMQEAYND